MRTTFFNVGHGDAILLEFPRSKKYDRHFVLRDFGRSRFAKLTENSCTPKRLIQHRCFCDPWFCFYPFSLLRRLRLHKPDYIRFDVMLSHAHDDHFNGFKLLYDDGLRRIFDNAYIPFLPMGDLNELGGLLIKYSLLMYRYFGPDTIEGENAKNWLLATPIMMALSKKMWCVEQGLNLSDWNAKATILWPPAQPTQAKEILLKNWKDYLADNNQDEALFDEDANAIRKILSKYSRLVGSERRSGSDDAIMTEYASIEYSECEKDYQEIQSILGDPFNDQQRVLWGNPEQLYESSYKVNLDNHSLMFELEDQERKNLFLSDAFDPIIKKMLKDAGIKDCKYHLIKSSHHGNRGAKALLAAKVKSELVVNCCGPAKVDWSGPDPLYKKVSNRVVCLDWWDEGPKWKSKSIFKINDDCCFRE